MRSFPPIRRVPLASYASDPFASRGRLHPAPESATRTPFQRDRDRIIHSTAFRRLKHKTQVFVHHEGDHYRTRLTHTIEVAQVARSIARALYLDEDLAEAVALAHDLGHPPFGHSGEDALDAAMAPFGGFDHNAQSLRIVTTLETRYADHDGLNLTWEALEGIVKHNGPLTDSEGRPSGRSLAHGVPEEVLAFDAAWSLGLDTYAGLEAQAAAIADDIAYNAHDIDDGLRAGLFDLEDLRAVPFLADLLDGVDSRHPGLDPHRRAAETVRLIVMALIEDVILTTLDRIEAGTIKSPADVRAAGQTLIAFSEPMAAAERDMKQFLFARMYRHERVEAVRGKAKGLLHDLFTRFLASPQDLPTEWRPTDSPDLGTLARRVCDYIAGMTDLYAVAEHRRLFDETPDLL